ncbi:MAG: hypothetical protein RMY29_008620 [Nostoc sp. CreGUA01]|nr:hypothetical protein [Nostoc sp. CreGUA01]
MIAWSIIYFIVPTAEKEVREEMAIAYNYLQLRSRSRRLGDRTVPEADAKKACRICYIMSA